MHAFIHDVNCNIFDLSYKTFRKEWDRNKVEQPVKKQLITTNNNNIPIVNLTF